MCFACNGSNKKRHYMFQATDLPHVQSLFFMQEMTHTDPMQKHPGLVVAQVHPLMAAGLQGGGDDAAVGNTAARTTCLHVEKDQQLPNISVATSSNSLQLLSGLQLGACKPPHQRLSASVLAATRKPAPSPTEPLTCVAETGAMQLPIHLVKELEYDLKMLELKVSQLKQRIAFENEYFGYTDECVVSARERGNAKDEAVALQVSPYLVPWCTHIRCVTPQKDAQNGCPQIRQTWNVDHLWTVLAFENEDGSSLESRQDTRVYSLYSVSISSEGNIHQWLYWHAHSSGLLIQRAQSLWIHTHAVQPCFHQCGRLFVEKSYDS